jgi:hypothetical protein
MVFQFFWPSEIWLNIDIVLKDFYIAIVLFFSAYVFERIKLSVGNRFVIIIPIVYFILQLFDDFIFNPIENVGYGRRIKEKFLCSPIIVVMLVCYLCCFVWNLWVTYRTLEASAEYTFWTYVGYFIAIVVAVICQIGVMQTGISGVRFGFETAVVNFFNVMVKRAHMICGKENLEYEETGKEENSGLQNEMIDLGVIETVEVEMERTSVKD